MIPLKVLCTPRNIEYKYRFCRNRDGRLYFDHGSSPSRPARSVEGASGAQFNIRIDSFNECGITEGDVFRAR